MLRRALGDTFSSDEKILDALGNPDVFRKIADEFYRAADQDENGVIDIEELWSVLRQLARELDPVRRGH